MNGNPAELGSLAIAQFFGTGAFIASIVGGVRMIRANNKGFGSMLIMAIPLITIAQFALLKSTESIDVANGVEGGKAVMMITLATMMIRK